MPKPKISSTPLEKIALSCSGGGYRAATFHLGTMAYLNRLNYSGKPLLEHVKMISTVSGGTITGTIYALRKQRAESFESIYKFLVSKITQLDLVKSGIESMNPHVGLKNKYKRQNIINAFAENYDEHFTEGATFKVFNTMTSHLEAVVFNSTEFKNAINFRFRNKGSGRFGNFDIIVSPQQAEEIKIADAMACSACFPGGFEPMMWPNDFRHAGSPHLMALAEATESIGIMDGGIYDNQGIDSILNYKKNSDAPYFDLVIISDVASPYMSPFTFMADKPKEGFRMLNLKQVYKRINHLYTGLNLGLLFLMIVLFFVPLSWDYTNSIWTGLSVGLGTAVLCMWVIFRMCSRKILALPGRIMNSLALTIPAFYREKFAHLHIEDISVRRMEPLIMDRVNSLITLLSNVFLKVVRRLNYDKLYANSDYTYRRITTLIKEFTEMDFVRKNKQDEEQAEDPVNTAKSILKGKYAIVVGEKMAAVATEASGFGTTLWFTEDQMLSDMLEKLIATGEFTMCYNMIEYLESLMKEPDNGFAALTQEKQDAIQDLYKQCLNDWARFKMDPMFMVNEMRAI
jgi:predicted acylesterase/phospholipase RssA